MKVEKIILGDEVVLLANFGENAFVDIVPSRIDEMKFIISDYIERKLRRVMQNFDGRVFVEPTEVIVIVPIEKADRASKAFSETLDKIREDIMNIKLE